MAQVAREADDQISRSPNEVDAQRDLMPLRSSACGAIRAELRKAGLSHGNDVEDIFQDACAIVVRVSGDGCKIDNIKAFLLTICRRLAWRYMRRNIRWERAQEQSSTELVRAVHGEAPISEASQLESRDLILKALSRLRARARQIIDMMYVDELSDAEIRKILGLSEVAFRVAKYRALKRLGHEILKIAGPREARSARPAPCR